MSIRVMIVWVSIFSLAGCTSMRAMDATQADFTAQLETGDHLVIYEKGGRIVDMTFTQVDGEYLVGSLTRQPLDTVEVRIDEILQIEIEKISGGKTAAAVVGGAVLLPIVAVGFGLAAFAEGQ
ncbi:MAG: hypothetical protein P8X81_10730 [Woeseiaceae bacterium]